MLAEDLSQADFASFNQLERIASAFSLCGTAFVVFTFLSSEAFQKPINRLVFYACLGNVFTNIASIMARGAIEAVHGGNYYTSLCQFQALLIQMFLPADALWTFVMALNVYLTFFHKFDAPRLRSLEKYYFTACYGIPFVPAFIFIFVRTPERGHMYGDATLWCWVSSKWDIFRIATFYGPVWLVILSTIAIYIYAGKEIYIKTKLLRDFHKGVPDPMIIPRDPFTGRPNDVVYITSSTVVESTAHINLDQLSPTGRATSGAPAATPQSKYNVTITAGQRPQSPLEQPPQNITSFSYEEEKSPTDVSPPLPPLPISRTPTYTRRPDQVPASMVATTAMLSYTKVAGLFFLAMMMTWIPSSANRVYSVINPGEVSVFLEGFSAFVLPLQGFWNALIYATTSIPACKSLYQQLKTNKRPSSSGIRNLIRGFPTEGESIQAHASDHVLHGHTHKSRFHDNDSETQLKESRPQTGKSRYGSADSGDTNPNPSSPTSRDDYSRDYASVV